MSALIAQPPASDLDVLLPAELAPWQLVFELWPQADAERWRAVLAQAHRGQLALLSDRPCDSALIAVLESRFQRTVRWTACKSEALDGWLGAGSSGFRALAMIDPGDSALEPRSSVQELSARSLAEQSSPVVRLLDSTLFDALQDGVSDVHFECTARGMSIRYRIDGVMENVRQVDGIAAAEQLVSRLKVMAELDIGERRLPQDGRFQLLVKGRQIDFRLSVIPSVFGEDAVVRVLDRRQIEEAQGALTLESLGFDIGMRSVIRGLALQPHGMLLVTGPTGSGKTTTLYATITEANTGRDKIITIEDPVEYQLPGVVQIPVNEKKGLNFARGLRSVLRHDPDRVMVGEIRDAETAQIAVQAALTGHLVFSSVHANNAFDVVGRFMHMGLDLYNVVSALNGIVAQRLMRVICPHCTAPFIPSQSQLAALGEAARGARFVRGTGCNNCRGSGYRGRRAVAEVLLMDDELRDLIAMRAPMSRIKELARSRGMRSLRDAALEMVRRGQSTLEELDRVTLAD